jgi:D-alanyl-D-alanine dipeptidase
MSPLPLLPLLLVLLAPARVPQALVPLARIDPSIAQALRYRGADNFTGRPVAGYTDLDCRLTPRAAAALARAQKSALRQGLSLVVHDCWRPPEAGRDFAAFLAAPEDAALRERFHPQLAKARLAAEGYVAPRSSHGLGETVDVTLADAAAPGVPLDLGTPFDFFDARSAHGAPGGSPEAAARRHTLAQLLQHVGFVPYRREWWHYTLRVPE